jgi:signal transduction histidine kinase
MDQAPVQNVDIVKGLETTLTILNYKLKKGVVVQRDYPKIPLLINSFGSELNQVWTNIIDNAIDAMSGQGQLRIRAYREDPCVVVEIEATAWAPEFAGGKDHILNRSSPPRGERHRSVSASSSQL